jgi:uncharacterized protein with NAD-binding domain and iron-sulfur cluster
MDPLVADALRLRPGSRKGDGVKKIAILGGGVGAMSAAFGLTSRPGWRDDFEITVYQMGWRLGGKGASGRNADHGQRIEEHGLHIWMGFYENAFRTMRACYEELGRPKGAPLATFDEAFRPHSLSVLCEFVGGRWVEWPIEMPVNSGVPGEGGALPTAWEYVQMLVQWLLESLIGPRHEKEVETIVRAFLGTGAPAAPAQAAVDYVRANATSAACPPGDDRCCEWLAWLVEHLHLAHRRARGTAATADREGLIGALEDFLKRLVDSVASFLERDDGIRRLVLLADLGIAAVKGILRDGVLERGFASIDDVEFRAWLAKNGASETALASAPVREIYDLCFAYENGDLARPNIAAGTALEIALRIAFTYKGAVMFKMASGMGDTVFGPLYEVLRRRGVKFEFFHQVEKLALSDDRRSIASIRVARQASLAPGVSEYRPFRNVRDLDCWPSEPHFDQLAQGEELRQRHVDLESRWNGWTPVETRELRCGADFDLVVLGISLGGLPEICSELVEASPAWKDLVASVGTVQTQAAQLWLRPEISELGCAWKGAVAGTYAEPLDTWADMSELLPTEDWPADGPRAILYLCGPKPGGAGPPTADTSYPRAEEDRVLQTAQTWLESAAGAILPKATSVANPAGLDWSFLYGPADATGRTALEAQYTRANIDPSERYVQSLAGSTKKRLPAGDSRFDNLYLAGDWVKTNLNAGCVEAAVMAGLAAARAIGGWPAEIVGWDPDEERTEKK